MELATWIGGTDALVELDAARDASWKAVDAELLAWCRDRAAMLLRHDALVDAIDADRAALLRSWSTPTA